MSAKMKNETSATSSNLTAETVCEFFVVVAPGLEEIAEVELREWLALEPQAGLTEPTARKSDGPGKSETVIAREHGGLLLKLPLREGLSLNYVLKVPTRILVRVADFGCRDFPKLFKKLSRLNWAQWVSDSSSFEWSVSSHQSRLSVKRRILETCQDARKAYLKQTSPSADRSPSSASLSQALEVHVRINDDVCTVSLDTSGVILHKRGVRDQVSEAPLRETLAAAILRVLESESTETDIVLVDPMAGAGTFFLEAAMLRVPIASREFAFERFSLAPYTMAKFVRHRSSRYTAFIGCDVSSKALKSAESNLQALTRYQRVQAAEWLNSDMFDLPEGAMKGAGATWLVANPPYDERIKVAGELKDYYERFLRGCERVAQPGRACIVIPEKMPVDRLKLPPQWRVLKKVKFKNGGIPVVAVLFGRVGAAV